jgi:hypothetical protein
MGRDSWAILNYSVNEEFEDTKEEIRIRKSRKNRQHNGQKKKDKQLSKNIHIKLQIE